MFLGYFFSRVKADSYNLFALNPIKFLENSFECTHMAVQDSAFKAYLEILVRNFL